MKKLNTNEMEEIQGGIIRCLLLPEEAGLIICIPFICPPGQFCIL